MTRSQAAIFVLAMAVCGIANAGNAGAGPAATAGPAVGATITPGSHTILDAPTRDLSGNRVLPGNAGSVKLSPEQLVVTEAILKGFEGAVIEATLIRVHTVLADGTPAMIALNTKTGVLNVSRRTK